MDFEGSTMCFLSEQIYIISVNCIVRFVWAKSVSGSQKLAEKRHCKFRKTAVDFFRDVEIQYFSNTVHRV